MLEPNNREHKRILNSSHLSIKLYYGYKKMNSKILLLNGKPAYGEKLKLISEENNRKNSEIIISEFLQ
jgi:hypothetical protein